ncbi:MAG: DUF3000 family protein [Micrococcaceae bacterium]
MNNTSLLYNIPEEFAEALSSIRAARYRDDIVVKEIPAPRNMAPYAVAMEAYVYEENGTRPPQFHLVGEHGLLPQQPQLKHLDQGDAIVVGRFVMLYDPEYNAEWEGHFRIIIYIRSQLEEGYEYDGMFNQKVWDWLSHTLIKRSITYRDIAGTATKISSESFGVIGDHGENINAELRASWTAIDSYIRDHVEAFGEVLTLFAGEPEEAADVIPMPTQRSFIAVVND